MNYATVYRLQQFFIILSFISVFAAAETAPPALSPIEQAQQQAMKKNRQGACAILIKALETAPAKSKPKLIESLNGISQMFFTDKAQRLFESGQSAMFESPDVALNQFRDALALEDGNILIQANLARMQISRQECAAALVSLESARQLNPFAFEPAFLELNALSCQNRWDVVRTKMKLLPPADKGHESYIQFLQAQDFIQQKLWRKAMDSLTRVSESAPNFPEVYYYLIKAGTEVGRETETYAHKYIALCKGITTKDRKHFALEPRLCANLKEVEDELGKKEPEV